MMRSVPLIIAAASLAACSLIGARETPPPPAATIAASPSTAPRPSAENATAACSALLEHVPQTKLNSGVATLAGAYAVTGDQLGNYFDRLDGTSAGDPGQSTFHDKGSKPLTMCLFDGDFTSSTPSGGQPDTNQPPRVLIVIEDGSAELWAIARTDVSGLPAIDPASIDP